MKVIIMTTCGSDFGSAVCVNYMNMESLFTKTDRIGQDLPDILLFLAVIFTTDAKSYYLSETSMS